MSRPIPVEEMVRQFKAHHLNSHIFRIDNFSLIEKHKFNGVESSVFDIGPHKWTLMVFPNGDKLQKGEGHISLYLFLRDTKPLPSNLNISVKVQLFILNQFKQDWHEREGDVVFKSSNFWWGFPRMIPVDEFGDPKKGYLVNGCSLFGVKILGLKDSKAGTAESLTMIENPQNNKFSWKMMRFSAFNRYPEYDSDEFVIGNRKWKLQVLPRGSAKNPDMLSVYLSGQGFMNKTLEAKTYARFRLRVLDQIKGRHATKPYFCWFPVGPGRYGSDEFMPLKDLRNPSNYLVNDTLYVEVEVDAISVSKYC